MTTMTVPMMTACYRWLAKYCRWAKARTCEMRCYRVQHMRTWWVCFFVNWGRVRAIGVHVLFEAHMRNGRYERRTVIKIKWKWKYLCCSDIFNDVDDGRTLAGPAAAPWQDSVALWCMQIWVLVLEATRSHQNSAFTASIFGTIYQLVWYPSSLVSSVPFSFLFLVHFRTTCLVGCKWMSYCRNQQSPQSAKIHFLEMMGLLLISVVYLQKPTFLLVLVPL